MAELLELILAVVAAAIYGTKEKPKHPIWRNGVRTIAFSGAFLSTASFLNLLGDIEFPFILELAWGFCALLVISAEYYVGSKKVCVAAFIVFAAWLVIAIFTGI